MFGNGAEGAGHNLDVNAAAVKLGQQRLQFAVADQRVSSDEGEMKRTVLIHQVENAFYQRVTFEIGQLTKRDPAVA